MFETILIQPLYNLFVFLIGIVPGGDVGLAIILLTLLIRAVFYPAFAASIRTQMGMQAAQGEIDEINRKHKDDSEARARATLALYKERGIHPFASVLALLVQLPVFLALYFALFREGLPHIAAEHLYSFVKVPQIVNVDFLGFIHLMTPHNILLTLLVAGLQYAAARLTVARTGNAAAALPKEKQMAHHMQRTMMLYFFPLLMAAISYSLPAAVGIYFAAGNIVSLGQELIIKRQLARKGQA